MQSRYLYEDLERLAQNRLSGEVYDYYAGGSSSDTTRGRTLEAWEQFRLIPRVLHSDGRGSDATHFLARELPSPLIVAPMAMASLLHPSGEEGIALAARAAGVSYAASFRSSVRPRMIGEAWHDNVRVQLLRDQLPSSHQAVYAAFGDRSMPALWYQVYLVREREISLACAKEAVNSGFEVAVVTVDTPYLGHRTRDVARGFTPVDLTVARAVVPAELSDSLDEREWVQAMTQRDDLR
ncbi:MAG: alpha-hydroxy-acid oxidizing protein, partial [Acidimicrobiales bacterium]